MAGRSQAMWNDPSTLQLRADRGQERADRGQERADRGQERADRGQERADRGQERADRGQRHLCHKSAGCSIWSPPEYVLGANY